ncbi:hypothetical protein I4U23_003609 [Adineta vaga]|nr:hypothetical protein I4U23_003609 [Adineta vaga]
MTNSKISIQSIPCCPRCNNDNRVCKWKEYLCINRATRAARHAFIDVRLNDPIRAISLADDLALLLFDLRQIARSRSFAAQDLRTLTKNSIGKRTKFCFFKSNGFLEYFICDSKHV